MTSSASRRTQRIILTTCAEALECSKRECPSHQGERALAFECASEPGFFVRSSGEVAEPVDEEIRPDARYADRDRHRRHAVLRVANTPSRRRQRLRKENTPFSVSPYRIARVIDASSRTHHSALLQVDETLLGLKKLIRPANASSSVLRRSHDRAKTQFGGFITHARAIDRRRARTRAIDRERSSIVVLL